MVRTELFTQPYALQDTKQGGENDPTSAAGRTDSVYSLGLGTV